MGQTPSALRRFGIWVLVLWVLDLIIKAQVSAYFFYGERLSIVPLFDLTLLHNKGAAFGFLADQDGWQRWFFSMLGMAISVWLLRWLQRTPASQLLLSLSLVMILAGALGNLTERIWQGYVVDYLLFYYPPYYFPAFNLADSLIFLGASGLLWDIWRKPKGKQHDSG
jgi:signal peptidase II